jgi:Family of unknown function (DUF5681)
MSNESKQNAGWFPKGRSGNREGRPPNRRVPQDPTFDTLSEPIRVNGPDGPRDMLPEEMLEWTTFLAALKGKAMAIREMTKWFMEYRAALAKEDPKPAPIQLVGERDPDNANEALRLLGITVPNSSEGNCFRRLLTPWSVQAAISRRRGGSRLTDGYREFLRRFISDPDSLRWPRGASR